MVNRLVLIKRFLIVLAMFGGFFKDFTVLRLKRKLHLGLIDDNDYRVIYASQARRFRQKANDLGGLLIKLGQFISVHVDVLPEEYTKELANLQDAAAAAEFSDISRIIEMELGNKDWVLEKTPLASASLGQVHKALLPDGDVVAVKVLKPDIDRLIVTDLLALRWVTAAARRFTAWGKDYDLVSIYREFEETTKRELDLHQEGLSAERIGRDISGFDNVLVPKIYWDYSSNRVLTMEFMDGVKITDKSILTAWDVKERDLSGQLFQVFWYQVMETGFFHADPHPGNIFVNQGGQLILLDFGMVGNIGSQQKQQLFELMTALMAGDGAKCSFYIDQLGFVRREVAREQLEQAMEFMLAAAKDMGNGQEITEEVRQFLYSQPFQLPANILFLGKTFSTLMGVCYGLDNGFDFMNQVTKGLGIDGGEKSSFGFSNLQRGLSEILSRLKKLYDTPKRLDGLALEIKRLGQHQKEQMVRLQGLLYSMLWAVLTAGSGLIAVVLYTNDKPGAEIGWAVTVVFGGVLFISLMGSKANSKSRSRRIDRRRHRRRGEGKSALPGIEKPKFHP